MSTRVPADELGHDAEGGTDGPTDSACPLDCPDACSLVVEVEDDRVVRVDGSDRNPDTDGFICGKVRRFPEHVHGSARIRRPAVRRGPKGAGEFESISWDRALDRIAEEFDEISRVHGAEAILPFSYGGSNGALTQDTTDARLFRRLGASRLARTVCAAPSTAAATGLYGKMAGVGFADYPEAELIVIWGCNPAVTGIHLMPHLREARRNGARLVVVDPREHKLARSADLHLAVRPGTDLPLALALIRYLFGVGAADRKFLADHATGVEELRRRADEWTLERAASEAGIPAARLRRFARLYAQSDPAVIRCGWGMERNRNGGSAIAAVLALPAVGGKFGVRGGGYTMSNSGVWQLDSTSAADADEPATREINMNRLGRALTELDDPPVKALFVYNANPLATVPRQGLIRRGLEREDLFTVVFDAVETDTARYADLLLPATTFLEHDEITKGYGSYVLHRSRPAIPPVGESRPNYRVFADLCHRCGVAREGDPEGPEELADRILEAGEDVPDHRRTSSGDRGPSRRRASPDRPGSSGPLHPHVGHAANLRSTGASFPDFAAPRRPGAEAATGGDAGGGSRGEGPEGVRSAPPPASRRPTPGPVQFDDVRPGTPDGRVHLVPDDLDAEAPAGLYGYRPDPASERYPLALISPASKRTVSSTLGQLRREQVPLRIDPRDAEERGIEDGDAVRVYNDLGEVRCRARIVGTMRPGVVYLPKGIWSHNTLDGNTGTALVPDSATDLAGGACFNDARVEVEPADPPE